MDFLLLPGRGLEVYPEIDGGKWGRELEETEGTTEPLGTLAGPSLGVAAGPRGQLAL